MKRILLAILLAVNTTLTWAADGIVLGYCNGQVTRNGNISIDGQASVEAAIVLTADMLAPYDGAQLSTVRVGLAARTNIDNLRVWVRRTLTGDNLAQGYVDGEDLKRGWNEVALDEPCTIGGSEPLFVGFTYEQRATSNALSGVDGTQPGAFWLRSGSDAEWQDCSDKGLLSLEAVVTGGEMVAYDLQLLSAEARYNAQGQIDVTAQVHNNASKTVAGFTLTSRISDTGETFAQHYGELKNGANQVVSFTLSPQTPEVGKQHTLTLSISELDDATDERPENNTMKAVFSYPRRVLIEEFTGEECNNCPRAAMYLHEVLATGDYAERTAMMAHHSGYHPDWLTFDPSDTEYEWLFNHDIAVYAPALMLDRVAQEAEYGGQTYMTPCFDPSSKDFIENAVAYMLTQLSKAYIDLAATVADGQLSVNVSGGRSQVFGSTPTRLTVCVVEDHIEQRQQASMNTYPEFEHMGALRAINTTWGDLVEWDANDHFAASYTFALDPEWKQKDLRVIAFVSDYDATDPTKCAVENTAQIALGNLSAGIGTVVNAPTDSRDTLYDLQGRPAVRSAQRKGIYVNGAAHKKIIL